METWAESRQGDKAFCLPSDDQSTRAPCLRVALARSSCATRRSYWGFVIAKSELPHSRISRFLAPSHGVPPIRRCQSRQRFYRHNYRDSSMRPHHDTAPDYSPEGDGLGRCMRSACPAELLNILWLLPLGFVSLKHAQTSNG